MKLVLDLTLTLAAALGAGRLVFRPSVPAPTTRAR
jgi:hypothetical protein